MYDLVRGLVEDGNRYKPFGDATRIIDIERTLHVFVEPSIQAWAQNKHWLMDVADWMYLNAHFFVTIGVLVFIYVRRNDSFYFVRNMFMIAMAIALIGYWLYPTAPPRLMPEWGFTDAISQFVGGWVDNGPAKAFAELLRRRSVDARLLRGDDRLADVAAREALVGEDRVGRCTRCWITFVVVATANHYLTDVFLGGVTAGVAALLAKQLLARARPDAWAFGHATA